MTDVIPRTTLAAVLTRHGAPPRAADHPLPEPAAGQCLVTVTAAPVVPLDLLCASGTSYFGPPALPYVPGVQGIGVVAAGESLAPGTRVWFATDAGMRPGDGGLARHAVVDERETVTLPEGVGDAQAAALGLSGVAAWMSLTWRGRLQPGEAVLVLGAGGVVGQVAVQVAVALGAGRVVAASRRAVGRERARRGGAAAVVDLADADVGTLEARMLRATDGARVDLVIDPVCGDASTAALRRLADGGRLVNLGSSGGPTASFASAALRSGSQSILGYTNNALTRRQRAEALLNVLEFAAAGRCTVDVEEYPLEDVAAAWTRAGAAPDGRVVVVPTHSGGDQGIVGPRFP